MSAAKVGLQAQIAAVDAARKIISGAERAPARASERDLLAEHLDAAASTLAWLRQNEFEIRAAMAKKLEAQG